MIRTMVTMTILVFLVILGVVLIWKRGQIAAAAAAVFFMIGIYAGNGAVGRGIRSFVTCAIGLF
jgi:hypothetical protein